MSKPSVMAISEDAVAVVDLMVVVGDDMLMMEAVMVEDDGCACCQGEMLYEVFRER